MIRYIAGYQLYLIGCHTSPLSLPISLSTPSISLYFSSHTFLCLIYTLLYISLTLLYKSISLLQYLSSNIFLYLSSCFFLPISLFQYLSFYISLPISLFQYLSSNISLPLSLFQYLSSYISLPISLFLYLSSYISLPISQPLYLSFHISLTLLYLTVSCTFYLSTYIFPYIYGPSICLPLNLSHSTLSQYISHVISLYLYFPIYVSNNISVSLNICTVCHSFRLYGHLL